MHCQRCRAPLKVDNSLEDLNAAALDLLVGATSASIPTQTRATGLPRPPYPQARHDVFDHASPLGQPPAFKRVIPAPRQALVHGSQSGASPKARRGDHPAMSFVMLTDSQVVTPNIPRRGSAGKSLSPSKAAPAESVVTDDQPRSWSHQMETTTRLFEILSARSDVDHPICVECTELLLDGLQKRLDGATRERDAYVEFLKRINSEVPTEEEQKKVEDDLLAAQKEEDAAFAELQALEREKAAMDLEIAQLGEEARQLDVAEEQFWRERNAFALTLSEFQNERDAINLQYDHDSRQLERLQRTNVYNDTFCIGHDGFFGTINGLRLGRLASQAIEWGEINAAWGQTLLLLATVADKLGFTFDGYQLKPMGSTSKIERMEHVQAGSSVGSAPNRAGTAKVTTFELYSSGDLPLGRMFLHRRFDLAMVAFLECLRQLGAYVEHGPGQARPGGGNLPGLKLPYEIKKDRIGDASIKLGFNQDEAWTRACKYTLTCCKFLLAHASNIGGLGRGSEGSPGSR